MSDIPSSSVVSSVADQLRVAAQDPCAARPEGAGSSGGHASLILLQTGVEEGVALVPERAALPPAGWEVAALPVQQQALGVLKVTDLQLKHAHRPHSLGGNKGEGLRNHTVERCTSNTCTSYTHRHTS